MPYTVRNVSPDVRPLVTIMRSMCDSIGASTKFHLDRGDYGNGAQNSVTSFSITAADGDGTLAKLLTLTKQIVGKYIGHVANLEAHKAADTGLAGTVTPQSVTTLATAITALNAVKAAYNTHIASTTYHYNADATNGTTANDATNQATADTLANELKADFNAHIASGNIINVPRVGSV